VNCILNCTAYLLYSISFMHCTASAGEPGFFHTPSKTKYLDLQVLPASNKGNTNYFNSSTSYFQTLNLKTSFSYFCPYFLSYNLFLPNLLFFFLLFLHTTFSLLATFTYFLPFHYLFYCVLPSLPSNFCLHGKHSGPPLYILGVHYASKVYSKCT